MASEHPAGHHEIGARAESFSRVAGDGDPAIGDDVAYS